MNEWVWKRTLIVKICNKEIAKHTFSMEFVKPSDLELERVMATLQARAIKKLSEIQENLNQVPIDWEITTRE